MKNFWEHYKELLADAMLIIFGGILIYIFVVIELLGYYGVEANAIIRRIEIIMGIPLIILGVERFIHDIRRL